jgi:general stress protein 26
MASDTDSTERVWKLSEKIAICMFSTWDGEQLRSRPMGAHVVRDEHAIYFLTDARQHKDEQVERYPQVSLAFADTGAQKYVAIAGRASVSNDRAKIRQLFTTTAKAWWDSADDPNIRVLKVSPVDAEYWDGSGTTISYMKMAVAAATGSRPEIGENRKTSMGG